MAQEPEPVPASRVGRHGPLGHPGECPACERFIPVGERYPDTDLCWPCHRINRLMARITELESTLRDLITNIERMAGFELGTLHPNDFGVHAAKKALKP